MDLTSVAGQVLACEPYKIVLSAPRPGVEFQRATLVPTGGGWQLERRTATQAFHENIVAEKLAGVVSNLLDTEFTQGNVFGAAGGLAVRISKKGKVLVKKTAAGDGAKPGAVDRKAGHDRKKRALLPEGGVVPPLVDMGVFTADGRVAAGMYDKYRQTNRFIELVDDAFKGGYPEKLSIIDFGCGKSYLTFVLYHYLHEVRGVEVEMLGLDLKEKVVANCNAAAEKYGYSGLRFQVGDIAGYRRETPVDMVVTLHACDTATDFALANAVGWGARHIFSVPCCQHELNGQMQGGDLPILTRYGIVQERTAALMTDAVRANLLAACGYKAQLVEFIELEHTPKNVMIRAKKAAVPKEKRRQAWQEVEGLCRAFGFAPTLVGLLEKQGVTPPREK